jgi:hypothetical protein
VGGGVYSYSDLIGLLVVVWQGPMATRVMLGTTRSTRTDD